MIFLLSQSSNEKKNQNTSLGASPRNFARSWFQRSRSSRSRCSRTWPSGLTSASIRRRLSRLHRQWHPTPSHTTRNVQYTKKIIIKINKNLAKWKNKQTKNILQNILKTEQIGLQSTPNNACVGVHNVRYSDRYKAVLAILYSIITIPYVLSNYSCAT